MMEENDEIYLFPFRLAALNVYIVDNVATTHLFFLSFIRLLFLLPS